MEESKITANTQSNRLCPQCGAPLTKKIAFCPSCGKELSIASTSSAPFSACDNNNLHHNSALKHQFDYNVSVRYFAQFQTGDPKSPFAKLLFSLTLGLCSLLVTFGIVILLPPSVLEGSEIVMLSVTLAGITLPVFIYIIFLKCIQHIKRCFSPSFITEQQYDNNILYKIEDIISQNKALAALDLDDSEISEAPPIIIHGYDTDNYDDCIIGNDGKVRTNTYKYVTFLFTNTAIHSFVYIFNTTQEIELTQTDEFFYKDIISIRIFNKQKQINAYSNKQNTQQSVDNQYFIIETSGGKTIEFPIPDAEALESVKAMRNLLKEKKNS